MRRFVRRTALRRVSREVLLRNVAVALGNTGSVEAVPALVALLANPSALVRGHAAWALAQIGGDAARTAIADLRARETDPAVVAELTAR
jgi:epoxyqueuosine reductase